MGLFEKNIIVGVSLTPEIGLEVAQIDFDTKTVLKYGVKKIDYNINQREIADLDIFKDVLQDLFADLNITKDAKIVLNLPPATFKVSDYPASHNDLEVESAIEEELQENHLFREMEPDIAISKLPNSSMQFNKFVHTALNKSMILEIVLIFKDLGYKIYAIDTSVNSLLNSLIYLERVNTTPDTSWVLMIVENYCCRILSMNGQYYVDAFEEKISIGEVLDDSENYSIVINAVEDYLKRLPSKYLCVVSKTNVISAEVLANKLTYSAPITYQEANIFSREAFLGTVPEIGSDVAQTISLDVIGASIYKNFEPYTDVRLNLYNSSLGDVYWSEQPPQINLFGRKIVLSNDNLLIYFSILAAIIIAATIIVLIPLSIAMKTQDNALQELNSKIETAQRFLKENENISSDLFDEGDEIRMGLEQNKNIYSYYTIVGTEIPQKLWLTELKLGPKVTIEGQADNLESVYSFFRNIKDYNPDNNIKLQKLSLASSKNINNSDYDTESVLTSLNADFYEFTISNDTESVNEENKEEEQTTSNTSQRQSSSKQSAKTKQSSNSSTTDTPSNLEPIEE